MTEFDKALIEQAKGIMFSFNRIDELKALAQSQEAREILEDESNRALRYAEKYEFDRP